MAFSPLLGNGRIKAAFSAHSRAPGAPVLLEGPAGSGRKTTAFFIAAGLLCRGQGKPCHVCPACLRMHAGTHPDCHVLEYPGKPVKVEQVRELRTRTFVKPQEAETKVFIIQEADKLSEQCQNALLKVLEEPQNCVFLLTCEDSAALLQTVRSRCVAFRMEPLERGELAKALAGKGSEAEIASAIEHSGGFLGRAFAALEGSEPHWQELALRFAQALSKSELELYAAASNASGLTREEYPLFLGSVCDALLKRARQGDSLSLDVYQYICSQREVLPHNPGIAALSGALAAHCGGLAFGRRGQ